MNKNNLVSVILAPCVSEKSTQVQINRQYVFRVKGTATKHQVARAVKEMFNVDAMAVRICNVQGKKRRFANIQGRHQDWKKAYVTLKEGQAINLGGA